MEKNWLQEKIWEWPGDEATAMYLLVGNQKVFDELIVMVSDIVDCLHTELLHPLSLQ